MNGSKRGQSGAAILVGLVAVLIILYVLFLPPEERARLLGEPGGNTPGGNPPTSSNTLFTSPVGAVYLPVSPQVRHDLPTVGIRAVEQGSILASRESISVSNNAFEKQPVTLLFSAKPEQTRNAVLSMNLVSKTGGNLVVYLNGQEIANQKVQSRTVPPITLTNLQQDNNLTFMASSVGFAFWSTNRYTLTNVKVTADVTDLSGAASRQAFSLAAEEYAALERTTLQFVPVCEQEGAMTITLNGLEMFSGVPDCDNLNTLEIPSSKLESGENSIVFATKDAQLIIDAPVIITQSARRQNRALSFPVETAQVQGKQVYLRILFPDAADHKGIITLNGNTLPLRAQDVLVLPVTQYVKLGQNTLSFEAVERDFEIVKVDVYVQ